MFGDGVQRPSWQEGYGKRTKLERVRDCILALRSAGHKESYGAWG